MAGKAPARIEVVGDRELRRALKRYEGNIADLRAVHKDVGEVIVAEARQLVPVVSGRLRDTIRSSVRLAGSKSSGTNVLAGRGAGVPYAGPIHFGWRARNIEPQPFLYDALDHRRSEVIARYEKGVDEVAAKFGRDAPKVKG